LAIVALTQNPSKEELEDVYKIGPGRCALIIPEYGRVAACFQGFARDVVLLFAKPESKMQLSHALICAPIHIPQI
jgi:hypothetical protein